MGARNVLGTSKTRTRKVMRNDILTKIRQYSDDPSSMKGDPLEDLGKFFNFMFVVVGLGIVTLVIELIIWIINNI
jgi:hypothetical protein